MNGALSNRVFGQKGRICAPYFHRNNWKRIAVFLLPKNERNRPQNRRIN